MLAIWISTFQSILKVQPYAAVVTTLFSHFTNCSFGWWLMAGADLL
jgi:hypothetical protein